MAEHKTTDRKELEALSYQTRIRLDEKEKDMMVERLNKDITFVESLFEVNVENVKPLFHVVDLEPVRRADVAGETLDVETVMALSRKGEYGYIVVPAVPAALESSEHKAKK